MSLIRRIRAALGIGVTWAVGWGVAGAAVFMGLWLALEPYQRARLATFAAPADFRLAATGAAAVVGLISGMVFALLLSAAERERDIDKVSGWRTALLGAVSSLGIFLLGSWALGTLAGAAIPAAVFAAFGAVSASKTLWIARRGSLSAGHPDAARLLSDDEGDGGRPGSGRSHSALCLVPLLGPVFIALAACAEQRAASTGVTVRDSAGIRIVENSAPLVAAGSWTISTAPVVEIGANEADSMQRLYSVQVAVRLGDGRIVIANAAPPGLRWYDSVGAFLHGTGRKGQGPGEFMSPNLGNFVWIWDMWVLPGDSIATWEHAQRRMQVFDPQGKYVRAVVAERPPAASPGAAPQIVGPLSDGFVFRMADLRDESGPLYVADIDSVEYFRYSSKGKFVRQLARLPAYARFTMERRDGGQSLRSSGVQPYSPVFSDAIANDGFHYGAGDRYEIAAYDTTGALRALIRRAGARRPLTQEIIASYRRSQLAGGAQADPALLREAERRLDQIPFPDSLPAYRVIRVDRVGMLWVQDYHPRGTSTSDTWSVFDRDGRWTTDVSIPTAWRIREIGHDYILAVETNELDVELVRMYRLQRGPG